MVAGAGGGVQRTLAIVKPDGVRANYTDAVKTIIRSSDFEIIAEKRMTLDRATAEAFYSEHAGKSYFHSLVEFMTSGPVIALVLEREHAVAKWRALIGPTDPKRAQMEQPESIRAKFGSDTQHNCVHGSDSLESAAREIAFFFEANQAG